MCTIAKHSPTEAFLSGMKRKYTVYLRLLLFFKMGFAALTFFEEAGLLPDGAGLLGDTFFGGVV